MAGKQIYVTPNGDIYSPFTTQDYLDWFTKAYQESLPPIPETSFPVKWSDLITKESNRWLCIGGPMDKNEGIAKVLKLKKGRGKNSIEVLVPINPEQFTIIGGGVTYTYEFNEEDECYYLT